MNDGGITDALSSVIKDLENWFDMLERQKKEREQKRLAEERDKKLNSVLKKKWIWW